MNYIVDIDQLRELQKSKKFEMKEDKEVQKLIEKLMNEIPLSTHLTVSIQLAMIDLLSSVGFRENEMWTDDEEDVLSIICDSAERLAKELEEELIRDYKCLKTKS